jgi:general secretion pathway protein F
MQFEVKALRARDAIVMLQLEAADTGDARAQAGAQGYTVLAIRARQTWRSWAAPKGGHFQLGLFSQELLALVDAGLTLSDAVETLAEKEDRAEAAKILRHILAQLYEGRTFSTALQSHPAVFPPLYVASVRASEKTGDLSEALSRYVAYQAQMDAVRKKIVSASIYPVLLVGVGLLVTLFLLGYVVPRFSRIYEGLGTDLPVLSKLLLQWGQLLQAHGALVVLAAAAGLALAAYAAARPQARSWAMQRAWRIPAVGARMRMYQLARFYRTLGMLLRGGIPISQALGMVVELLHPALRAQLQMAGVAISEGRSVSHAMETHRLTTSVAVRMLRVGEKTGQMGDMMERIAAFYDDEMARWVDWFTRLFEPLLMAFIGLVIGAIVVLMYLPIFELAGSLQ